MMWPRSLTRLGERCVDLPAHSDALRAVQLTRLVTYRRLYSTRPPKAPSIRSLSRPDIASRSGLASFLRSRVPETARSPSRSAVQTFTVGCHFMKTGTSLPSRPRR